MDYIFVKSHQALADVCARAAQKDAVALDTEFVRTRTLTPQLGLLQLFDGDQLVLIDPLAIDDMQPLIDLLVDESTMKVLHSCSEDLETLLTAFGVLPTPVFDTQFAASVLGLGATMGYARLIETLLSVSLEKGESRTDWLARPLTDNQCRYAADDVLYLLPAYDILKQQIDEADKLDWVVSEVAVLGEKKRAQMPVDFAYLQIKNNWRLSSEKLTVLQALAAWRLQRARDKDLALNFVFRESHLYEVANRLPNSKSALSKVHSVTPQELRMNGDTVLKLVDEALTQFANVPEAQRLPRVKRLIDVPEYKQYLSQIKQLVDTIAQQNNVAAEVVASKKQINQLLKWWWFEQDETRVQGLTPDLLTGWRAALFTQPLHDILGEPPTEFK